MSDNIFTAYAGAILMLFAVATHNGYAWDSLFSSSHRSGGAGNHYHK
jgi:hypothetical protein